MANSPLIEPFILNFDIEGKKFTTRVTYTKAGSSCSNIFEINILQPSGYSPFTLHEKPLLSEEGEVMTWIDQDGRQTGLYQVIGARISEYMKTNLGIVLMDSL